MEFNDLQSALHMSLLEAGYGSGDGQSGWKISGAVSGVTTPGALRLQASQLQERSATTQRLQTDDLFLPLVRLLCSRLQYEQIEIAMAAVYTQRSNALYVYPPPLSLKTNFTYKQHVQPPPLVSGEL